MKASRVRVPLLSRGPQKRGESVFPGRITVFWEAAIWKKAYWQVNYQPNLKSFNR